MNPASEVRHHIKGIWFTKTLQKLGGLWNLLLFMVDDKMDWIWVKRS